MRIIKNSVVAIKNIAKEMYNIENGRIVYPIENANSPIKLGSSYPSYMINKTITDIKTNIGVLYLPDNIYHENEIGSHFTEIKQELTNLAANDPNKNNQTVTVHGNFKGFISVKKIQKRKRIYSFGDVNIINNSQLSPEKVSFIWVILPINNLLDKINHFDSDKITYIDNKMQLVSILYDLDDLMNCNDTDILSDNITSDSFKDFRNFSTLSFMGLYSKGKTPIIPKMSENIEKLSTEFVTYHKKHDSYPEFKGPWHLPQSRLLYCPIRKSAVEVIRQLGNWAPYAAIYNYYGYIPIHVINNSIYAVNYKSLHLTGEICEKCSTPLYDDIYVIVANKHTNVGNQYCGVCMHSKFIGPVENEGIPLYKSTDIIVKTTYPRTLEKVAELLQPGIRSFVLHTQMSNILVDKFMTDEIHIVNASGELFDRIITNIKNSLITDNTKSSEKYINTVTLLWQYDMQVYHTYIAESSELFNIYKYEKRHFLRNINIIPITLL